MNHNSINLTGPVTAVTVTVPQQSLPPPPPSQQQQQQQQQPSQQQQPPPPPPPPSSLSDDYLEQHDEGNHFFGNKCMPMKSPFDSSDYMIVTSEEIIDILDLTNDEVEQILDDNMISSQDFDTFNSPRLSQSMQQFNRVPRINFATNYNLTKADHHHSPSPTPPPPPSSSSPPSEYYEGKIIDMRSSLETPTINLDSIAAAENSDHNNDDDDAAIDNVVPKLATMTAATPLQTPSPSATTTTMAREATAAGVVDTATAAIADQISSMPIAKKKSGRTKGARQISMCIAFVYSPYINFIVLIRFDLICFYYWFHLPLRFVECIFILIMIFFLFFEATFVVEIRNLLHLFIEKKLSSSFH